MKVRPSGACGSARSPTLQGPRSPPARFGTSRRCRVRTAVYARRHTRSCCNHHAADPPKSIRKAKIVGFAGVPTSLHEEHAGPGHCASMMDAVSEHSYGQIERPEANLPKQTGPCVKFGRQRRRQARSGTPSKAWAATTTATCRLALRGRRGRALHAEPGHAALAGHRQVLLVLGPDQPDLRLGRLLRGLYSRGRGWRR